MDCYPFHSHVAETFRRESLQGADRRRAALHGFPQFSPPVSSILRTQHDPPSRLINHEHTTSPKSPFVSPKEHGDTFTDWYRHDSLSSARYYAAIPSTDGDSRNGCTGGATPHGFAKFTYLAPPNHQPSDVGLHEDWRERVQTVAKPPSSKPKSHKRTESKLEGLNNIDVIQEQPPSRAIPSVRQFKTIPLRVEVSIPVSSSKSRQRPSTSTSTTTSSGSKGRKRPLHPHPAALPSPIRGWARARRRGRQERGRGRIRRGEMEIGMGTGGSEVEGEGEYQTGVLP
ncbi:hypothetical protein NLI96_g12180 [Meripilus lineatus]|uniref:Uncharacterized protein n=1 Tax=Meripilus lineatus TaxID=2056292 RepID=A0AAD5UQA8_9APHY|nr:hypothetical protein NLI96_g12180 [Physisporinus lineatus]